jgi:asparagine synthase (glutamine-hydrolysing)
MCGIAGLLALHPIPELPRKLVQLSQSLAHRGPDDEGFLTWDEGRGPTLVREHRYLAPGRLALVHRRLSIVDLSPSGWQPMADSIGRSFIVFNGEIYNYRELRAELESQGVAFRSTSDTEVLLAILARDGTRGLGRLVGMYAFAYIDFGQRRLLLARDPLGIKPLHYCVRDGQLAFASEIKPLLSIGAARPYVNRAAVFRYLRHAVTNHGGQTVFADIRELEPGCHAEVTLDEPTQLTIRRHWEPPTIERPRRLTAGDAARELRALVERSIELHLRADVPCAAALSGGVDSSGIVSLMRRHLGGKAPLDVFSYVADEDRLSEQRWAKLVAEATGARLHEVRLDPNRLAEEVDELIATQEQPFTTTSMWAQAHVYRAAREAGFKIVLDGQGADEIFAGYGVFRAARLEGLVRRGRIGKAASMLSALPAARAAAVLQTAGNLLPEPARRFARRAIGKPIVPPWLDSAWFGPAAVEHRPQSWKSYSPLSTTLRNAVTGSSLPMLLRYADRNAMAASVENRVPYLTTAIVEFAQQLPDELLIASDGTLKAVLREALRGIVPDAILNRRDKIGFETPESKWFAEHASVRALASETAILPLPPCFRSRLRDELAALGAGNRTFSPHHWRAINVIRWSRRFDIDWEAKLIGEDAAA